MSALLPKAFSSIAKSLREFGYPNVTADEIKGYHAEWLAGKEATDIVAMFAVRDFENEEYRMIFTEQPK